MSKNKIIVDLRRLTLTNDQIKTLHNAIHRTVSSQLKKVVESANKKQGAKKTLKKIREKELTRTFISSTANLSATFTNTNPGNSSLKAILNGQEQSIDRSGIITFTNVQSGDIVMIQGDSLGTTTVTIDISSDPTQMNFPPGHFNDNFFIN